MLGKADAFTILNAALGFLAITYISDGKYVLAEALILLAVVMDGLDGIVARRFGGGKAKMGDYLDIMADYLSFCVAPAILFYQLYFNIATTPFATLPQDVLVGVAAGAFVTLGLLRLARHVAKAGPEAGRFQGLPTTGAGLFATLLVAVGGLGDVVTSLLIIGAAWLMVSEAPYPKVRGMLAYASGALVLASAAVLLLPAAPDQILQVVLPVGLAGAALYTVSGITLTLLRVPIGDHTGETSAAPAGADPEARLRAFEDAMAVAEAEQKRQLKKREAMERELAKMRAQLEELISKRSAADSPAEKPKGKSSAPAAGDTQEVDPDA
jgi:archaetidylserine synthase